MLLARFMQVPVPVTLPGHLDFIIPVTLLFISPKSLVQLRYYSPGHYLLTKVLTKVSNQYFRLETNGSGSPTSPGASSFGGYPSFPRQSNLFVLCWMNLSLIAVASIKANSIKAKTSYGDSVPTHMSQVPAAISPVPLLWATFSTSYLTR